MKRYVVLCYGMAGDVWLWQDILWPGMAWCAILWRGGLTGCPPLWWEGPTFQVTSGHRVTCPHGQVPRPHGRTFHSSALTKSSLNQQPVQNLLKMLLSLGRRELVGEASLPKRNVSGASDLVPGSPIFFFFQGYIIFLKHYTSIVISPNKLRCVSQKITIVSELLNPCLQTLVELE